MTSEYKKLLKRISNAEEYLDSQNKPEKEREFWIPKYLELVHELEAFKSVPVEQQFSLGRLV